MSYEQSNGMLHVQRYSFFIKYNVSMSQLVVGVVSPVADGEAVIVTLSVTAG